MAVNFVLCLWLVFLHLLAKIPGVVCDNDTSVEALLVSAIIAVVYLVVILIMLMLGFTWNSWYPRLQWSRGRVKMPERYWKRKEEVRRQRLMGYDIHTSGSSSSRREGQASLTVVSKPVLLTNGHPTSVADASWIHNWNYSNPTNYEEMSIGMDLQEEEKGAPLDEIRIETTVAMDTEGDPHLDLSPVKDTHHHINDLATPASANSAL